ncbi:MAG TPA: FKBP-type peptidyl-prolyl cis-trans isomerase [Sphingomonadaceae bacterium]|nr:FKBP-type peptidyl-prolyl cis-trans isomerase [Sphingomonadaceae bacterium]
MSSVTAVPLPPIARGSLVKLWIGVIVVLALAVYLGWRGTARTVALQGTPAQYLAWNGARAGVQTTASGLQYQVLTEGEGEHPTASDVALVNYVGKLRDGTIFDQQQRAPIELSKVIPGWAEGLQHMSRGAKYRFWIPPALGYGDRDTGNGAIPANSVLEFDVELIDFIPAAVLHQQMEAQGIPAH